MKRYQTFIAILILAITFSLKISAQESPAFTGIVVYKMSAIGNLSEGEKAQIEGTITTTYGDGVYKTVTNNIMMNQTQIIFTDSLINITEAMGQKYAFRMTKEQAESLRGNSKDSTANEDVKVNYPGETKDILGYTCSKAEIAMGDDIMEVYVNKDFSIPDFMREDNLKKVDGLPFEYTFPFPGKEDVSIHMEAVSIKKKKKISDKEFTVPADTKIMSFEELRGLMGQ